MEGSIVDCCVLKAVTEMYTYQNELKTSNPCCGYLLGVPVVLAKNLLGIVRIPFDIIEQLALVVFNTQSFCMEELSIASAFENIQFAATIVISGSLIPFKLVYQLGKAILGINQPLNPGLRTYCYSYRNEEGALKELIPNPFNTTYSTILTN